METGIETSRRLVKAAIEKEREKRIAVEYAYEELEDELMALVEECSRHKHPAGRDILARWKKSQKKL